MDYICFCHIISFFLSPIPPAPRTVPPLTIYQHQSDIFLWRSVDHCLKTDFLKWVGNCYRTSTEQTDTFNKRNKFWAENLEIGHRANWVSIGKHHTHRENAYVCHVTICKVVGTGVQSDTHTHTHTLSLLWVQLSALVCMVTHRYTLNWVQLFIFITMNQKSWPCEVLKPAEKM
jgi:hypothetical protein